MPATRSGSPRRRWPRWAGGSSREQPRQGSGDYRAAGRARLWAPADRDHAMWRDPERYLQFLARHGLGESCIPVADRLGTGVGTLTTAATTRRRAGASRTGSRLRLVMQIGTGSERWGLSAAGSPPGIPSGAATSRRQTRGETSARDGCHCHSSPCALWGHPSAVLGSMWSRRSRAPSPSRSSTRHVWVPRSLLLVRAPAIVRIRGVAGVRPESGTRVTFKPAAAATTKSAGRPRPRRSRRWSRWSRGGPPLRPLCRR